MKTLAARLLAFLAKRQLNKFKPKIIGVTGSVGKSSTTAAIALALQAKYRARQPYKNYNNDFGLPLAILGERSPGRDTWEWLKLLQRAITLKDLPEYLVLEYGVDTAGDMDKLLGIAVPDVVVITAISAVHVTNYPDLDALINEKAKLGEAVKPEGLVVLNNDDVRVAAMRTRFQAPVQSYSLTNGDAYATDIRQEFASLSEFATEEVFVTTKAILHIGSETAEISLKNCCSTTLVSSALAAVLVAVHEGVALHEAAQAVSQGLQPVNGRLRPLAGIKGSLILDDSYNAAPASVKAGLAALHQFKPLKEWDRRIAVLGDMAELGSLSAAEHQQVGEYVAQVANVFIAVGPEMKAAVDAAQAAGLKPEDTVWFPDSVAAGRYLDNFVKTGDVILVKGSQSMRMEKIVKDIMAEPNRAGELLVRQEAYWLTR
jgi:UDP-N-acetylmuramoyl-tripeptide--D-alanyl-D-alanine ligase